LFLKHYFEFFIDLLYVKTQNVDIDHNAHIWNNYPYCQRYTIVVHYINYDYFLKATAFFTFYEKQNFQNFLFLIYRTIWLFIDKL